MNDSDDESHNSAWTPALEKELLDGMLDRASCWELSEGLGRSPRSIALKLVRLNAIPFHFSYNVKSGASQDAVAACVDMAMRAELSKFRSRPDRAHAMKVGGSDAASSVDRGVGPQLRQATTLDEAAQPAATTPQPSRLRSDMAALLAMKVVVNGLPALADARRHSFIVGGNIVGPSIADLEKQFAQDVLRYPVTRSNAAPHTYVSHATVEVAARQTVALEALLEIIKKWRAKIGSDGIHVVMQDKATGLLHVFFSRINQDGTLLNIRMCYYRYPQALRQAGLEVLGVEYVPRGPGQTSSSRKGEGKKELAWSSGLRDGSIEAALAQSTTLIGFVEALDKRGLECKPSVDEWGCARGILFRWKGASEWVGGAYISRALSLPRILSSLKARGWVATHESIPKGWPRRRIVEPTAKPVSASLFEESSSPRSVPAERGAQAGKPAPKMNASADDQPAESLPLSRGGGKHRMVLIPIEQDDLIVELAHQSRMPPAAWLRVLVGMALQAGVYPPPVPKSRRSQDPVTGTARLEDELGRGGSRDRLSPIQRG